MTLYYVIRLTGRNLLTYLLDLAPYFVQTAVIAVPCVIIGRLDWHPLAVCVAQAALFAVLYLGVNFLMKSKIQRDVLGYFRGKV